MDNTLPTLEETLIYNRSKAILNSPCVVVDQIMPSITIIKEYEEKFNISEKDKFNSSYTNNRNSGKAVPLLEPLCNNQPKLEPLYVYLVPKSTSVTEEEIEFMKHNKFVHDPRSKKCCGIVPYFRLDNQVWKYHKSIDSYLAEYINKDGDIKTYNFSDDEFRASITPVIPSQWLEL